MGSNSAPPKSYLDRPLADSRSRLTGIVQSAMDAIISVDADQRIVLFNAAAEKMFRCRASEVLGSPVERFIPQHLRRAHGQHIHDFAMTGETSRTMGRLGTLTALRADGEEFPIEAAISQAVVEGQPLFTVVLRDVTERMRAEAALRESEERFRVALKHSPIAVYTTDRELRYTWIYNPGLGVSADAMLGKKDEELLPFESVVPLIELKRRVLQTGRGERQQIAMKINGSESDYDITAEPLFDAQGAVCGVTVATMDVTELTRARAAADAANAAKSQFLANMSHELRTPMNAILGMTDLALSDDLSPTVRDYLQTVKESGTVLLELLNQLLDFSRIEAGALELEQVPLSVRRVVEQVVKTLGVQAAEKNLELVYDIHSDVPEQVIGDPLRLREILMNLMGNAIKFTQRGEVVVRVECGKQKVESRAWPSAEDASCLAESPDQRTEDGPSSSSLSAAGSPPSALCSLRFSVTDTGIGIPPEDQRRIFSAFTQVDASTTRRYGGSGLGLSIVRKLVELMGGQIWVQSQPGLGSTFGFAVEVKTTAEQADTGRIKLPDRESLRCLRALAVVENPTSRRVLQQYLAGWGLQADAAGDVPNALAKIHEAATAGRGYRVVLADAQMQGVDGVTLAKWLRSGPSLAGPVILMLSAADRQTLRGSSRTLDVACLEKPFSQSDLWNVVAGALGFVSADDRPQPPRAGLSTALPRPLRVLLAEDNPANQKVTVHILSRRGHSVEVAGDGRQAVELLQQRDFDVILMDVQMPILDGLQATEAIRRLDDPRRARLPIIAMTAHARREDAERCSRAGMDAYLSKPIKAEELIELVERLGSTLAVATRPEPAPGAARAVCPAGFDQVTTYDIPGGAGAAIPSPVGPRLPAPPKPTTADLTGSAETTATPPPPHKRAPRTAHKRRAEVAPPSATFELAEAITCCFGSRQMLQQMVDFYFVDAPILVKQMRESLHERNRETLARAAHRLRGTLVYLAAHPAAAAADRLEQLVIDGYLSKAPDQLAELERELERLDAALTAYRTQAET